MSRGLSLDLARLTGWSVGSPDGVEAFGTHLFPQTAPWELGEYGMAARITFRRMLAWIEPAWAVYEAPILRSGKIKTRGNGKQFVATVDTPQKLRKIYLLPAEFEIECLRAGVPVREANMSSVRSHFLMGTIPRTSEECKLAVKSMARRRGWDIADDNEADSLAVLDYELAMKFPNQMAALRINAGRSGLMSSSGPDVFVGSRAYFPPATKTAAPEPPANGSAGPSSVSSTGPRSPSATMGIIPPSSASKTSSTSSASRATPAWRR